MLKKTTTFLFMMLLLATITSAQNVTIDTYGVTDREAAVSAEDIFDLSYNGLTNVGTGTKVYLKGYTADKNAANGQWFTITLPSGSAAQFGSSVNLDSSNQVISVTLDLAGKYVFQFSNGTEFDEITFNAGTYLGLPSGFNCTSCHSTTAAKWVETKHATTLQRGLNGTLSSHFGENCVRCHSTGYDANASNNGFDDRDFVFPDTLSEEAYNQVLTNSPLAMQLANVQCESCHGPGSEHMGNTADSKIVSSISQESCAKCHDSGTHHVFPSQWDISGHAKLAETGHSGQTRAACIQCHSGNGFVSYIKAGKVAPTANEAEKTNITCATCHDPHDATNPHQLRTVTATLSNGVEVTDGGLGMLCMNCHKTRRDAVTYTDGYLKNLSAHYGPHYGPQADIITGNNIPDLGKTFATTNHFPFTPNACVSCHMNNQGAVDTEGNVLLSGGHSFSMSTPDGVDNVAACAPCHSIESFDKLSITVNGKTDFDGDGTSEGLQHEVEGMLEEITMLLPPLGSHEIGLIDSSWSPIQAKAFYIWEMAHEDGSLGIHNPKFVVGFLEETLIQLKGAVGVDEVGGLPISYSLDQNYPNPFNPSTTIRFSVPEAGNVRITVYDVIGKEIEVLVNKDMNPGVFNATWNAANYASGIYFYKMQTNNFVSVKKMILVK
ncbi:MAG: T9SS type A sorting domain-containing protein [Bacteroidetes bacterium]|nr:T9SS type A sorting domain-containing protein [Bacteroidota bacterium]